jgi:hypothetical protein
MVRGTPEGSPVTVYVPGVVEENKVVELAAAVSVVSAVTVETETAASPKKTSEPANMARRLLSRRTPMDPHLSLRSADSRTTPA